MNLFETVELIQKTAQEAKAIELKPMPNNPQQSLLIGGGTHEVIDTPYVPGDRKHTVESVASFAAAYARWGATGGENGIGANVWIDLARWSLMFYVDEPLRRAWVKLTLTPAPQLLLLLTFKAEKPMEQKALVRMLRHDLADCVDAGVLAAFRSVDFQKITNARASIQHEKQSLDADIVAQVTGEKKPDGFLVDAPLFAMKELEDARTRVFITIDIDCDNRKFVLQAKPGHVEMALDDARLAVLSKLEAELSNAGHSDVTILAGSPE